MLLNQFNGGLSTRLAPYLLSPSDAQVFENIDHESFALKPLKDKVLDTTGVDKFFTYYYANSELVSKATETSFVEYRDKLYYTQMGSYPVKYDGTNTYRLGIVPPTTKPSITKFTQGLATTGGSLPSGLYEYIVRSQSTYTVDGTVVSIIRYHYSQVPLPSSKNAIQFTGSSLRVYRKYAGIYRLAGSGPLTFTDTTLDISANAKLTDDYPTIDFTLQEYKYVYTYYNANDGAESGPSPVSEPVEYVNSDDPTNICNIAWTASSDPQVTHVRVYRVGNKLGEYTLVDEIAIGTTNLTDSYRDTDIAGNDLLQTFTFTGAPTGLKYIMQNYAMLFGSINDKLYYSNIGEPNSWPSTNFIDFEDNITGIGPCQNGILVFTKYRTYIVTGNSPETFSKFLLSAEHGCISHYSIQFSDNSLIWLSINGVCTSAGGPIDILTKDRLGKFEIIANPEDISSVVLNRVYYLQLPTYILVLDFRYGFNIKKIVDTVSRLGSYNNLLYAQYSGNLYEMFGATGYLTMKYKSPILTEGLYSNYKIWKDFYVKYIAPLTIKIYIDGELKNTFNLDTGTTKNLKALDNSSGYGLEIEVEGLGTLQEIEYKVQGRQNGK